MEQPVVQSEDIEGRHGVDQPVDGGLAQNDGQRGHAFAVGRAEFAVKPEFAPRAADHADADEQRLLDDDHDDCRHDEGTVSQVGVEQVVRLVDYGLRRGLCLRDVRPLGDQALEFHHRARAADRGHQFLESLAVHQEVAGVDVDRHVGLRAPEHFFLVVRRYIDHAVYFAVEEELLGLLHVRRVVGHVRIWPGVERCREAAAGRGAALVHHADRHVAQHLCAVGHRVDRGVDDQRENQDEDDACVGEYRAEFVAHDRQHLLPVGRYLMCEPAHVITSPSIFPPCRSSAGAAGTGAVRR